MSAPASPHPGPTLEYNIKAWCAGGCKRPPSKKHEFGLDFEQRGDGHFYLTKVEGLAKEFTEVKVGDRLYKFQDVEAAEYKSIEELHQICQDALKISIETLHPSVMKETIKIEQLPVEKGDVVPIKGYDAKPEFNGEDVEVLRKLPTGKLLVSPLRNKKEKLLIDLSNLDFEIETDKLTLKDREDSDDEAEGGETKEETEQEAEVAEDKEEAEG